MTEEGDGAGGHNNYNTLDNIMDNINNKEDGKMEAALEEVTKTVQEDQPQQSNFLEQAGNSNIIPSRGQDNNQSPGEREDDNTGQPGLEETDEERSGDKIKANGETTTATATATTESEVDDSSEWSQLRCGSQCTE